MKTLQLISPDESIIVNYLTDLIGENESLTVYQIKEIGESAAGSIVLSDAAIQAGLFLEIGEYNLGAFKAFATTNEYSLKIFENGETVVDAVDSVATDILSFSFPEETGAATINATAHTVDIEVANGTDPSALVATFGLSYNAAADISDTAQVSGTTENDFSSEVTYTITAEDGTTEQDWAVTVTVAD